MVCNSRKACRTSRGFTLLEILVVVIIISVVLGSVLLSTDLGNGDDKKAREEADRLIALISLAQEEAIFQSREYGLSFWVKGYAFYQLTPGGWVLIEADKTFRTRKLPGELEFELVLEGLETVLKLNPKFEEPQVFIMSSGETSVFELTISNNDNVSYSFTVDALGQVKREDDKDED